MRLRSTLLLVAVAAATIATPAAAAGDQAPDGWLACGQIFGPGGDPLWVELHGATACGGAVKVMRRYDKRIAAGDCQGQLCLSHVNGYRCVINTTFATETAARRTAASCTKGKRRINAVDVSGT